MDEHRRAGGYLGDPDYLVIWPTWWLPLATQPFSHAVYMRALQTVCETMVSECAIRIQSGWLEF